MIALLLALAAPLAPPLPLPLTQDAGSRDRDDVERLAEWPEAGDEAAVKRAVAKLRKAHNDEMATAGRDEIEAAGAAAAPFLLGALGRERDEDARERLTAALDAVTTSAHTRLLAVHLDEDDDALRRYAVRRVATLGDPGLRERAEARLADLEERAADPDRRPKVDERDLDLAAVLSLSTGSTAGLERVLALAGPEAWESWGATLSGAADGARAAGEDVAAELARRLAATTDAGTRVALLHLLAHAGTKDRARSVLPCLDAEESHVKVAAINALRRMVDGDPPLERLSTFDAIERANRWKNRL